MAEQRLCIKVNEEFFDRLPLEEVEVDESKDKIGLRIEDRQSGYRVLTKRADLTEEHFYIISIFNSQEQDKIISQTSMESFRDAVIIHYSAIKYLKQSTINIS